MAPSTSSISSLGEHPDDADKISHAFRILARPTEAGADSDDLTVDDQDQRVFDERSKVLTHQVSEIEDGEESSHASNHDRRNGRRELSWYKGWWFWETIAIIVSLGSHLLRSSCRFHYLQQRQSNSCVEKLYAGGSVSPTYGKWC